MTDRELLEMAAKAAGYEFARWHVPVQDSQRALSTTWNGPYAAIRKPESPLGECRWNPLTDDGDALRLAVRLNIHHHLVWDGCHDQFDTAVASRNPECKHVEEYCGLDDEQDIYKATRRAIVRAAAEIGKAMP